MFLRTLSFAILLLLTATSVFGQDITIGSDPVVDNHKIFHIDKSNFSTYSDINKTSGDITSFKYFPGYYWTHQMQYKLWEGEEVDSDRLVMRRMHSLYLDYNKDGKLDLFGFYEKYQQEYQYLELEGILFLYNDFYGEKREDRFDTDLNVGSNKWYLSDIDNDGFEEIITKNEDGHIRGNGVWPNEPFGPVKVIDINTEGEVTQRYIGNDNDSHDMAIGDIDNDGDIDIVSWESSQEYPHEIRLPMFYMNNGDGTFYKSNFEERFKNKELLHDTSGSGRKYQWFHMLNLLLIDINNDSYLDLVVGDDLNSCKKTWRYSDFCDEYTKIFWNDGSGRYDFKDYTILENNSLDKYHYLYSDNSTTLYTVDFIPFDFNSDGYLDLFSIIDFGWEGTSYIQVHQNNGDKSFTDVTEDVIENIPPDVGPYASNECPITDKYTFQVIGGLVPYDKDNDGDYDIVPYKVDFGGCRDSDNKNNNNGVYWENINGKFSIVGNITLSAPFNESTGIKIDPTLSWSKGPDSESYVVQVTTDYFESFKVNENLTDTSFTTFKLEYNTTYSWRVLGINSSGDSSRSEVWTFTTQYRQLSSSTPQNPQDEQDNVGTLTDFNWSEVDSVESYHLQISTESSFSTLSFESTELDSTTYTLAEPLEQNTQYYWRVRSLGKVEQQHSEWSDVLSFTTGVRTSVEEATLPTSYSLNQNYPNPFNPTTSITYSLPQSAVVSLKIYDITGKYITTLVDGVTSAGIHTVTFDAGSLSSGMYVYTLETDGYRQSRQMMLVK